MSISDDARFLTLGPEVAARIQAREFVLLSYLALAGTLLSGALTQDDRVELALAIPYIALATALISTHHDLIIGAISDFMRELSKNSDGLRWHHHPNFLLRGLRYRTIREVGVGFFMIVTVAASLFLNHRHMWMGKVPIAPWTGRAPSILPVVLWWGGLASGVGVLAVMVITYGIRHEKQFARKLWFVGSDEDY